jgi:hypothetical protein
MVRSFPFRFARPAQSEALGEDLGTIRAGATGATLDGQARRGDATYAPQIWGWHLKSGELTGGTILEHEKRGGTVSGFPAESAGKEPTRTDARTDGWPQF